MLKKNQQQYQKKITPVGVVADADVGVDDVPGVGATTVIGVFPDCISLSCSLICIL